MSCLPSMEYLMFALLYTSIGMSVMIQFLDEPLCCFLALQPAGSFCEALFGSWTITAYWDKIKQHRCCSTCDYNLRFENVDMFLCFKDILEITCGYFATLIKYSWKSRTAELNWFEYGSIYGYFSCQWRWEDEDRFQDRLLRPDVCIFLAGICISITDSVLIYLTIMMEEVYIFPYVCLFYQYFLDRRNANIYHSGYKPFVLTDFYSLFSWFGSHFLRKQARLAYEKPFLFCSSLVKVV